MEPQQKYSYAVIGGGVYGLSIAYHLSKSQQTVALFQRFTIGHANGSSHGPQRITRSVYSHPFYRDMNTMALRQYWPEMQEVLNSKFIYPNQFICFEERKQSYAKEFQVFKTAETKMKLMSSQYICKVYPSMPYIKCDNTPIVDQEAGMIAADDYISRLSQYLKTLPNVAIFQNTEIKSITKDKKQVTISSQTQIINVDKIVVAAGRWVLQLFPQLNDILHVRKQYLTYVNLQNSDLYQFGRIPSFVHNNADVQYYTTPDRKGLGYKIGSHSLQKVNKDEALIMKETYQIHNQIAAKLFKQKFKGINKHDQCYYTITQDENFIIDWIDPESQQILICSCCSGHGFKFSPLIGKVISDLLLARQSIYIYEKNKYLCQIPYHRGINLK